MALKENATRLLNGTRFAFFDGFKNPSTIPCEWKRNNVLMHEVLTGIG
ncbi:hypothetical protein [Lacticaseibacillus chiayiensis]|nr:hypothetical protein [Lacticaseibacillus chiayiensis]